MKTKIKIKSLIFFAISMLISGCLLYTSDAADDLQPV